MTAQSTLIILLAAMVVAFASGRFRIEIVALLGLAAAFALGLVPEHRVFSGFSSPTVITVLEILLIMSVLARSHLLDALGRTWPAVAGERMTLFGLLCTSACVSVFMNNIGALAVVIPLVLAVGARHGLPVRSLLMPVSFATLLGGLGSVIGTPANLLVAQATEQLRQTPFGFFEIGLVGIPVAVLGLIYLTLATPSWSHEGPSSQDGSDRPRQMLSLQLVVPPSSGLIGQDTKSIEDFDLNVIDHKPVGRRPGGDDILNAGDLLFVEATAERLHEVQRDGHLALLQAMNGNIRQVEAVIMPDSIFIGTRLADLEPLHAEDIIVDGLRTSGRHLDGPFAEQRLRIGDVLVLRGSSDALTQELADCGLLALAQSIAGPRQKASILPLLLFACGVALTAVAGLAPEIAFGLVVIALALTGVLSLRRGLETINWPILIMLGAMIPIGAAVESTGLARTLVDVMTGLLPVANLPSLITGMVLLAALLTPFVNNPSTFLMLAPIAIETARHYGVPAEPLVLAVGVGASLDFLTPFGHHNNTLAMGLGGYGFRDFLRLGGPLLLLTGTATVIILSLRFS